MNVNIKFPQGNDIYSQHKSIKTEGGFFTDDVSNRQYQYESKKTHALKISTIRCLLYPNYSGLSSIYAAENVLSYKLMGRVLHLKLSANKDKWSFMLEDGTGCIKIEWLIHHIQGYNDCENSKWAISNFLSLKENTYVSVYGVLNCLVNTNDILHVYYISPVDIPEEIFFHDLQILKFLLTKNSESKKY